MSTHEPRPLTCRVRTVAGPHGPHRHVGAVGQGHLPHCRRTRLADGDADAAADLVEVAVLEADELRDVYERWPRATADWIRGHGVSEADVAAAIDRLGALVGEQAMTGIEAEWPQFTAAAATAAAACRQRDAGAAEAVEHARAVWQAIHDRAVDRVSGLIDVAVRLVGEEHLGALWDFLMDDWYDVHARRYSLDSQPWSVSAHQLMIAIVDGFHAHLTGTGRQGDIEIIEEPTRVGFRFAPCGSGGRSLDARISDGAPRAGAPYGLRCHHRAARLGLEHRRHLLVLRALLPAQRSHADRPSGVSDSRHRRADVERGSAADVPVPGGCTGTQPTSPTTSTGRVGRDPARRPARATAKGAGDA